MPGTVLPHIFFYFLGRYYYSNINSLRKTEYLTYSYVSNQWQRWDVNPDKLSSKFVLLIHF